MWLIYVGFSLTILQVGRQSCVQVKVIGVRITRSLKLWLILLMLVMVIDVFLRIWADMVHKSDWFVFLLTGEYWVTEHMQDIVGLLFKYIHLLQKSGACKWIFDEVCQPIIEFIVFSKFYCQLRIHLVLNHYGFLSG